MDPLINIVLGEALGQNGARSSSGSTTITTSSSTSITSESSQRGIYPPIRNASVSLKDAKASDERVCRRCESAQNGGYDTRPCPHCGKAVVITHWQMHVRECSGSSQLGVRDESEDCTDSDELHISDSQDRPSETTKEARR